MDGFSLRLSFETHVKGNKEQVGNYVVEPPGLFLGRGDHPKAGMRKARIMPEDVTLNLDEDAPIPPCPVPGYPNALLLCHSSVESQLGRDRS